MDKELETLLAEENKTAEDNKEPAEVVTTETEGQSDSVDWKLEAEKAQKELARQEQRVKTYIQKLKEKDNVPADVSERVAKLEFKENLIEKAPQLKDKASELYELKKQNPNLDFDKIVALHIGSQIMSANPSPSGSMGANINIAPREQNIGALNDDELMKLAKQEAQRLGYNE